MTTTFENARVNDRCFCLLGGKPDEKGQNATILRLSREGSIQQVYIQLSEDDNRWFMVDGRLGDGSYHYSQLLFWSAPQIIAPEQPKRMRKVKRTVQGWMTRYGVERDGNKLFSIEKTMQFSIPATLTYEDEEEEG